MRSARNLLRDVLKYRPFVTSCDDFHHKKKDQHGFNNRLCRPLGRWNELIFDIEKYLRQTQDGNKSS